MGKRSEAERILKGLPSNVRESVPDMAGAYVALGDIDAAFRVLSKAVKERRAKFIKADPRFDPLHSDPRWLDLMRRMNFPVGTVADASPTTKMEERSSPLAASTRPR
jgi:hypothetical protein